jgi:hypothetical protein
MNHKWIVVTATRAAATLIVTFSAVAAPPQVSPAPVKTAGAAFKNVKVLKDAKESDLYPAMNFIAGSLGVTCEFCHVNPWDSDEKPQKRTARKMIQMLRAINQGTFDGQPVVTCNTCHRGSNRPVGTPAIELAGWQKLQPPGVEGPPKAVPAAGEIFKKYFDAIGSEARARALQTLSYKGRLVTTNGMRPPTSLAIEQEISLPNKMFDMTNSSRGATSIYWNGDAAWVKDAAGVRELPSDDLADLKATFETYIPVKVRDVSDAAVLGPSTVHGRDTWAVEVHGAEQPPLTLYFDAQNGLLLRRRVELPSILGNAPEETDFLDYRETGGVKLPFKIVVSTLSARYERDFDAIAVNVRIPTSRFEKPQP